MVSIGMADCQPTNLPSTQALEIGVIFAPTCASHATCVTAN